MTLTKILHTKLHAYANKWAPRSENCWILLHAFIIISWLTHQNLNLLEETNNGLPKPCYFVRDNFYTAQDLTTLMESIMAKEHVVLSKGTSLGQLPMARWTILPIVLVVAVIRWCISFGIIVICSKYTTPHLVTI